MDLVTISMCRFNGIHIYGKVVNHKLTMWLPVRLYNKVSKYVLTFLPHQKNGLLFPGVDYQSMVTDFIHNWIVSITGQECSWEINDFVPEFSMALSQWQEMYRQEQSHEIALRVTAENISEVLPGSLGPSALVEEDSQFTEGQEALDLSIAK